MRPTLEAALLTTLATVTVTTLVTVMPLAMKTQVVRGMSRAMKMPVE
jgi:hypothetical protein